MATSLAPPTASAGFDGGGVSDPHDIHAELGETLNSAISDTGGGDNDTGTSTELALTQSAQEASPDGEQAANEGETGVASTEPFPMSEDGKAYLVPKDQLADVTGMREYSTAVQEWFPTVADAQAALNSSTDFRSMQLDYESGDPGNIDRALRFWSGANAKDPYTQQRFQESFATMAQRAPQLLQQINPQAFQQLSRSLASPFIERMYAEASQQADPAMQKEALRNAQAVEYAVRMGDPEFRAYKFTSVEQLPKHDPNAEATRASQQAEQNRVKGIEQREAQLLERDFNAFNQQSIDGKKIGEVWNAIDSVLAPIKAKYDEADYAELRTGVMADLTKALKAGTNAEWFGTHAQEHAALKRMFQQCWKSGQDPNAALGQRAQYYINDLLVRARRALPAIAAPRITKATGRTVAAAQPKNATARPRTQQTPPAATPEKNGNQFYNINEDQEFGRMFKM